MEPLVFNPQEDQYPQQLDWSCSACSLAWLNRALGIQHATDEPSAIAYIGEPEHINSLYGLMDGSGTRLRDCLREQGAPAFTCWASWEDTLKMAASWPLLIGGAAWYHWVGVRGTEDDMLWIANSAEGWMGVTAVLDEDQWVELGPFAVVAVPLLHSFPPPPTT